MRLPIAVHKVPDAEAWRRDRAGKSVCWLVRDADGVIVGLLEKVRGEPYKAFAGVGRESRYLGSSYEGRGKALDMIVNAGG